MRESAVAEALNPVDSTALTDDADDQPKRHSRAALERRREAATLADAKRRGSSPP